MTNPRRLDQAPQDQHDNTTNEAAAGAPHIEQFDYRKTPMSESGVDPLPSHMTPEVTAELKEPAIFRENPIAPPAETTEVSTVAKAEKSKLGKYGLAGGALLGLGGVITGVVIGLSSDKEAPSPQETGSRPVATGEAMPGQSTITPAEQVINLENYNGTTREQRDQLLPTEYTDLPEEVRANDRAERFNTYLHTAWETIQPALNEDEKRVLYMPDLTKPRAEWTDQDYLNYRTLATWLVTTQADINEGLRAASVVANAGTEEYEFIKTWIGEHPGQGLKAVYEAIPNPLSNRELTSVKIGSVTLDANGGRLIGHRSLASGATNYSPFKNYADSKGNIISIDEYTYDSLANPDLSILLEKYAG